MANYSKRLSFVTGIEFEGGFTISDTQWSKLKAIFGAEIGQPAREELNRLCQYFLNDSLAENSASTQSAVTAIAKKKDAELGGFWNQFAGVTEISDTDANSEFEHRFREYLERHPIPIEGYELAYLSEIPLEVASWMQQNNPLLTLSNNFLMRVAIIVGAGLDAIKSGTTLTELQDMESGFEVGRAWSDFLLGCRGWTKTNKFSYGSFKSDGSAGALPRMIFLLNQSFPDNRRHRFAASADAVAQQIKKMKLQAKNP